MELRDVVRSTASIRSFTNQTVDDALLYEILDDARFAPSGGNRQAWRVIVVKDQSQRDIVGAIYLETWHDYIAQMIAGVIPYTVIDRDDSVVTQEHRDAAAQHIKSDDFASTLAHVPVLLVVLADLKALAATDRDLNRYQFVGGASVYPFAWNILLGARSRGLGGVFTTVAIANEAALRDVLDFPETFAVATVIALGYPTHQPKRLTRRSVEAFATIDSFDGAPFEANQF